MAKKYYMNLKSLTATKKLSVNNVLLNSLRN